MKIILIIALVAFVAAAVVQSGPGEDAAPKKEAETQGDGEANKKKEEVGDGEKGEKGKKDEEKKDDVVKQGQEALEKHKDVKLGWKLTLLSYLRKFLPEIIQKLLLGIHKPKEGKEDDGDADYHKQRVNYYGSIAKHLTDNNRAEQAKAYWQEAVKHHGFAKKLSGEKEEAPKEEKKGGVKHHTDSADKLEKEIKEQEAAAEKEPDETKKNAILEKVKEMKAMVGHHQKHAEKFGTAETELDKKIKDDKLEDGSDGFKKAHGEHHQMLEKYFREHAAANGNLKASLDAADYHQKRAKGFLGDKGAADAKKTGDGEADPKKKNQDGGPAEAEQ